MGWIESGYPAYAAQRRCLLALVRVRHGWPTHGSRGKNLICQAVRSKLYPSIMMRRCSQLCRSLRRHLCCEGGINTERDMPDGIEGGIPVVRYGRYQSQPKLKRPMPLARLVACRPRWYGHLRRPCPEANRSRRSRKLSRTHRGSA